MSRITVSTPRASMGATARITMHGLAIAVALAACAGESVTEARRVARVQLEPASMSATVGTTRQVSATAYDAADVVMPGVSFEWSSSAPEVASVSATGLVEARAAGPATITARASGIAGTASAVVTPADGGGGSGALAVECASPRAGWIWCDDFEQDRLASYFEVDGAGGRFVRLAGAGVEGSYAMRSRFSTSAQTSSGNLKLAFGRTPSSTFRPVDAGTANYREIYWRHYLLTPSAWTGGAGDKLSRAMILAGGDWSQAMIAHVWGASNGSEYLLIDPASGTDEAGTLRTSGYNDFANLRWLGNRRASMPTFSDAARGTWHCIEARVRLNDAGASNGVFQLWIDGVLAAGRTDLNWVGSYSAYGINAVFFENYWNAGSPVVQDRFFDNIVVSTQPIGC